MHGAARASAGSSFSRDSSSCVPIAKLFSSGFTRGERLFFILFFFHPPRSLAQREREAIQTRPRELKRRRSSQSRAFNGTMGGKVRELLLRRSGMRLRRTTLPISTAQQKCQTKVQRRTGRLQKQYSPQTANTTQQLRE